MDLEIRIDENAEILGASNNTNTESFNKLK